MSPRAVDSERPAPTQIVDLILGRRSFRGPYLDQRVPDQAIAHIVQCGLSAPASKNAAPTRLHVVTNPALLRELAKAVEDATGAASFVPLDPSTGEPRPDWLSTVSESAATLARAPAAIFIENIGVFGRGRATIAAAPKDKLEAILFTYSLEIVGVGASIMNMWIAALSLGLQAVFMGDVCVAEKTIAEKLGIKGDLAGMLAFGYSATPAAPRRPTRESDESRVCWLR